MAEVLQEPDDARERALSPAPWALGGERIRAPAMSNRDAWIDDMARVEAALAGHHRRD
jgi:hypothetical protein